MKAAATGIIFNDDRTQTLIIQRQDVPVWAFHGAKDEIAPLEAEQMLVDALKACGGNVQFTIFPDIGHDVDSKQVYTSELFTWMLDQTRK